MNKRETAVAACSVLLTVFTVMALGLHQTEQRDPITPTFLATPKIPWRNLDTAGITASQAYPAVGDRDYTTVAALAATKTVTWQVPADVSGVMFRFETTANADSTVLEMLVAGRQYQRDGSTDDDFAFGAQFALTGGQQTGSNSNVYVDTVVVTDGILDFTAYDSAADRICVVKGDLEGYDRVTFIASTLQASSTCYVYARWW